MGTADSLTVAVDSMMKLGRLKKNLERSKILKVVPSLSAFDAVSKTGRKT
jgi:hypothetical protein